jgi:hypothetical protein
MKTLHSSFLLILGFAVPLAYGQKNTKKPQPGPVETTVCKVLGDPSAYNNRLVESSWLGQRKFRILATGGRTLRHRSNVACVC